MTQNEFPSANRWRSMDTTAWVQTLTAWNDELSNNSDKQLAPSISNFLEFALDVAAEDLQPLIRDISPSVLNRIRKPEFARLRDQAMLGACFLFAEANAVTMRRLIKSSGRDDPIAVDRIISAELTTSASKIAAAYFLALCAHVPSVEAGQKLLEALRQQYTTYDRGILTLAYSLIASPIIMTSSISAQSYLESLVQAHFDHSCPLLIDLATCTPLREILAKGLADKTISPEFEYMVDVLQNIQPVEGAPERRNVFENDAFSRGQVDPTRIHQGRRVANINLNDKSVVNATKSRILTSQFDEFDPYDDERDDTYDDVIISRPENHVRDNVIEEDTTKPISSQPSDLDLLLFEFYARSKDIFRSNKAFQIERKELGEKAGMTDEQLFGWRFMLERDQRLMRELRIATEFKGEQQSAASSEHEGDVPEEQAIADGTILGPTQRGSHSGYEKQKNRQKQARQRKRDKKSIAI